MTPAKPIQLPGINIQAPWAEFLLSGKKQIETRFYAMPAKWVDKPLVVIETPGPQGGFPARVAGIIVFAASKRYQSKAHFESESHLHLVRPNDPIFGWKNDEKPKWGWPVRSVIVYKQALPPHTKRGIRYASAIPLIRPPSFVREILAL